jgi:hypothetical protein
MKKTKGSAGSNCRIKVLIFFNAACCVPKQAVEVNKRIYSIMIVRKSYHLDLFVFVREGDIMVNGI